MKFLFVFFTLFLTFLVQPAFAVELGDLEKLLKQHQIYQVDFTQKKTIPFLKKPFVSSGNLIFHHKKGIFWNSTKPLTQSLVISAKGLFEVKNNRPEALAGAANSSLFSAKLFEFFGGDLGSLQETFELVLAQDAKGYKVTMAPKGQALKSFLKSIVLKVDSQGKLREIQIFEANQSSSKITLGPYKILTGLGKKEKLVYEQIQH
ncbi:MAG: outer membrane lipoprotein carrier protein LolA [SAR324 cluster bacterium]|nr:outer membrane lipoprotein carrier protein LolA [SAR324 cluster bacterium]